MRLSNLLALILILFIISPLYAQKGGSAPEAEEEDYYIFPINPGDRGSLSGTMGELRSTHFHTGIDIRTGGVTGLAVHAAAQGDIVRVAVSPGGYGNALYILHPNGTHTVYAHLEKFHGPIAEYVRQEQYRRKTWNIDLYFPKGKFPVNKGDTIALSGNSGSSGGPHLHFDIRDENHDLLNPLKYNFEEVWDNTPPVAKKLAVKTFSKDARVDNVFGRREYDVVKKGDNYIIKEPINVYGNVGLEVYAYDILDNSSFRTGITEMEVVFNGEIIHRQEINTFSFSDQRNILVHMPYEVLQTSRERFHKLYVEDGNNLSIYNSQMQNGLTFVENDCDYPVEVIMRDTYNNESKLSFTLHCKLPEFVTEEKAISYGHTKEASEVLIGNTLKISVPKQQDDSHNSIVIFKEGVGKEFAPDYISGSDAVYLWDMREGLPDSADYCGIKKIYNFEAIVPSTREFHFTNNYLNIDFPINTLFDTLYLQTSYSTDKGSEFFQFGDPLQPVRRFMSVTLKPNQEYDRKYFSIYSVDASNNIYYQGGTWGNEGITFKTRDFGKYTIAADSTPPVITPVLLSKDNLKFTIADSQSGIKDYEVFVDGEWVLMHYDYKQQLIWSEKPSDDHKFKGEVKIRVTDNQGNTNTLTRKL